jgi:hypothetical protein
VSGSSGHSELRDKANGMAAIAVKGVADVLHPPGLHLLSLACGANREAILSHRALFIQTNSLVSNTIHDTERDVISRVSIAIFWLLPSLVLGICLAWLIARNAAVLGLSDSARRAWILAALAFSVVAYITYRLTRPDLSLVTCANCGRLRRVDQGQCHQCNAQWDIPELAPPVWRVV